MRASFSVLCLLLSSGLAHADPVELRPGEQIAEFTIPDHWEVKRIDAGVQLFSNDYEVYIWIETHKPDQFQQIVAAHDAYLKKQGVDVGSSDEEKRQENGKDVSVVTRNATWNGKPTVFYYKEFQLGLPSRSNVLFTYWASPKGDKTFQKDVADILASLKVTEK
jgi:hypothetical protein